MNDNKPAVMRDALLDDLRRQNLALKEALSEASSLLSHWICGPTLNKMRRKWALLIGEEL